MNNKYIVVSLLVSMFSLRLAAVDTTRYPDGNLGFCGDASCLIRGSFDGWLPLKLQAAIDPTFNDAQKMVLVKALKIFLERGLKKNVLDCAFSNSSRDFPVSREHFLSQLTSSLMTLEIEGVYLPSFAYIARYWGDPKSVGLGFLNLFYDEDKPLPGYRHRHYLHVAINSDFLGDDTSYWLGNSPEYWAGVLAHEFLHNLGYHHPKGYPGSFITEYGHCIYRNGADATPPEGEVPDREVMKEL